MPRWFSRVICRRLQRRALNIARKNELEGQLAWLSQPLGESFLKNEKLHDLDSGIRHNFLHLLIIEEVMTICEVLNHSV